MHASFPAILRLVVLYFHPVFKMLWWFLSIVYVIRLRMGKVRQFVIHFLVCHGCVLWRGRLYFRISARGLWWYDYRAIEALNRWVGKRSHCNREFPWYFKPSYHCKRVRVTSMQSDRRDTIRWMLSRNVSIICLCVNNIACQCFDLVEKSYLGRANNMVALFSNICMSLELITHLFY